MLCVTKYDDNMLKGLQTNNSWLSKQTEKQNQKVKNKNPQLSKTIFFFCRRLVIAYGNLGLLFNCLFWNRYMIVGGRYGQRKVKSRKQQQRSSSVRVSP
ncbi:hypothetical protein LINGRAPRIM_LOCUS999 [Linum grandiflorum]